MQRLVTPKTSVYNTGPGAGPAYVHPSYCVNRDDGLGGPLLNILLANLRRRENTLRK